MLQKMLFLGSLRLGREKTVCDAWGSNLARRGLRSVYEVTGGKRRGSPLGQGGLPLELEVPIRTAKGIIEHANCFCKEIFLFLFLFKNVFSCFIA